MIHRAYALSSTTKLLSCALYLVALTIYPTNFIGSAINNFLSRNSSGNKAERNSHDISTVRISLTFNDQLAAKAVRKQLVFVSNKSSQDLKPKEIEQSIVNKQLFTIFHVKCAQQILSGKQPDAFINALLSTKFLELVYLLKIKSECSQW